jgi:Na+-translocating ferredoxin:NAD+ oxidoreductase RnfA subunit
MLLHLHILESVHFLVLIKLHVFLHEMIVSTERVYYKRTLGIYNNFE